MNKRDIEGFKNVLTFLDENQKGAFGIGKLNRYQLSILKYVGIGEGMEYEPVADYEIKELCDVLVEEVKE